MEKIPAQKGHSKIPNWFGKNMRNYAWIAQRQVRFSATESEEPRWSDALSPRDTNIKDCDTMV